MRERYVHTLRYRYHRWNHRPSRKMFPVSYGPFRDEDEAREWIRQSGITTATMLMSLPAAENIDISHSPEVKSDSAKQLVLKLETKVSG